MKNKVYFTTSTDENHDLRTIDNLDGKQRVREFYAITPEAAYDILEGIAMINGLTHNLKKNPK